MRRVRRLTQATIALAVAALAMIGLSALPLGTPSVATSDAAHFRWWHSRHSAVRSSTPHRAAHSAAAGAHGAATAGSSAPSTSPATSVTTSRAPATTTSTTSAASSARTAATAAGNTTTPTGAVFPLADYGGVCDGGSDVRPALAAAFSAAAKAGGGTVTLPAGRCRIAGSAGVYVPIPGGVSLDGAGAGATSLVLDSNDPAGYRELLQTTGSHTTISDVSLTAGDVYAVLLRISPGSDITVRGTDLAGPAGGSSRLEGVVLPDSGTLNALHLESVSISHVDYGLMQTNSSTAHISDIAVTGSTFSGNASDDLAFNSPEGVTTGVTVRDSHFTGAGMFGISLANIQDVTIDGNTLESVTREFVHIENRSRRIVVSGNNFSHNLPSDQDWYSFVWIGGGTGDVTVRGNSFVASDSRLSFACVWAGPGGDGAVAPTGITVQGNTAVLGANTRLVFSYGGATVAVLA